jgi:hypothetical protein
MARSDTCGLIRNTNQHLEGWPGTNRQRRKQISSGGAFSHPQWPQNGIPESDLAIFVSIATNGTGSNGSSSQGPLGLSSRVAFCQSVRLEESPTVQRLALRRVLTRLAFLWTAKSSSLAPAFSLSRNQTGCAPLPAHVLPDLSRYLTGTLRPFSELPRALNPIWCPTCKLSFQLVRPTGENIIDFLPKLQKRIN